MLERTQLGFNLDLLKDEFQALLLGLNRTQGGNIWVVNEIGLSHVSTKITLCNEDHPYRDINTPISTGVAIPDFSLDHYRLARSLADTETESVYYALKGVTANPFTTGRMRYVKVDARTTQPLHKDIGFTYYIALEAHPLTFFLVNSGDGLPKRVKEGNLPMMRTYNVAEDGHAYILDGSRFYAIANTGNTAAYFLAVETNRVHQEKPEWTGLTAETMTGNDNVLDGDLRNGTIFHSTEL